MKKNILLVLFLLPLIASAQGINFETSDWTAVLEKAKVENKPVFVDVYTSWCGPCKAMDKQVFPREDVGQRYNASYVSYKIDAEKGEGIEIAKKYGVKAYPTYLFINPADGNLIGNSVGSSSVEDFLSLAEGMLEKHTGKSIPIEEMNQRFASGTYDEAFLVKFLERKKLEKQSTTEAFRAYLSRYMAVEKEWTDKRLRILAAYFETRNDTAYTIAFQKFNTISKLLQGDDLADLSFEYDFEKATGAHIQKINKSDITAAEKVKQVQQCLSYQRHSAFSVLKKDKFRLDNLGALYKAVKDTAKLIAAKREYITKYLLPDSLNGMIGSEPIIMDKKEINYIIPAPKETRDLRRISSWCSSYAMDFSKIMTSKKDRALALALADKACRLDNYAITQMNRLIVLYNSGKKEEAMQDMPALLADAEAERSIALYKKTYEKMQQGDKIVSLH